MSVLDRLIQTEKDSVYDSIMLAVDAAERAVSTSWSIFDDEEKDRLLELERKLRRLQLEYRATLKEAGDAHLR